MTYGSDTQTDAHALPEFSFSLRPRLDSSGALSIGVEGTRMVQAAAHGRSNYYRSAIASLPKGAKANLAANRTVR